MDPRFIAQACAWLDRPDESLLGFVWTAHDRLVAEQPLVDGRDLERSITQLLEPRIRDAMTGYEPFYVQHGAFERGTMAAPPAQPPEYDLGFVWRADERVIWPLEAKVLETPGTVAAYDRDLRNEFLTCRYAPFTASGAMIGYLLSGASDAALKAIAAKTGVDLEHLPAGQGRPQRVSRHRRTVPAGKAYPVHFNCYHLILEYTSLKRNGRRR